MKLMPQLLPTGVKVTTQCQQTPRHDLNKTGVTDQIWKPDANRAELEGEIFTISRPMKGNYDGHDLTQTQAAATKFCSSISGRWACFQRFSNTTKVINFPKKFV